MPEPYTRIRLEIVGSKNGKFRVFRSYCVSVPWILEDYVTTIRRICELYHRDPPEVEALEQRVRQVQKELLAPEQRVTPRRLEAKLRYELRPRMDVETRVNLRAIAKVLQKIQYSDFVQLPKKTQEDLIRWLEHRDKHALWRLTKRGLRWKSYQPGDPGSLFPKGVKSWPGGDGTKSRAHIKRSRGTSKGSSARSARRTTSTSTEKVGSSSVSPVEPEDGEN